MKVVKVMSFIDLSISFSIVFVDIFRIVQNFEFSNVSQPIVLHKCEVANSSWSLREMLGLQRLFLQIIVSMIHSIFSIYCIYLGYRINYSIIYIWLHSNHNCVIFLRTLFVRITRWKCCRKICNHCYRLFLVSEFQ